MRASVVQHVNKVANLGVARDRVIGISIAGEARSKTLTNLKRKNIYIYICVRENHYGPGIALQVTISSSPAKQIIFFITRKLTENHCQSGRFTVKLFLSKFN